MIKTGDLLLFKPVGFDPVGRFIQFFSDGHLYCHSAIAVDSEKVVEMNHAGTMIGNIEPGKTFDVYRMNGESIVDKSVRAIDYARYLLVKSAISLHDNGIDYNFIGCIGQGISEVLDDIIPEVETIPPIFNDDNKLNCSQFAALSFRLAFDMEIIPGISFWNVKPDDLRKTPYFELSFSVEDGIIKTSA